MVRELHLGGSERQLSVLATTLPPSRFEVHVGCLRPNGLRAGELEAAGVRVVDFAVPSFHKPSAVSGAYRILDYVVRNQIQLVHTFDWPTNVFAVPIARTVPGLVVLSSQRAHRELSPGLPRHLLRVTDEVVDGIVVNSQFVRHHLVDEEKVPSSRIHVCYNGIDLEAFSPGSRIRRAEFESASLVIGVVCALRPEKGLRTLVDAFARVSNVGTGLRLAIVGSGPSLSDLQSRSEELGITSQCTFIPATREVAALLRGIDVFVLPSLSEAFSNSLMEAMACGCCAVASDVGGNPELIAHGQTGLLFPPGDSEELARCLRLLIENHALRCRLAEAGLELIHRNFSQEDSARRMAEIYVQVLGDRN